MAVVAPVSQYIKGSPVYAGESEGTPTKKSFPSKVLFNSPSKVFELLCSSPSKVNLAINSVKSFVFENLDKVTQQTEVIKAYAVIPRELTQMERKRELSTFLLETYPNLDWKKPVIAMPPNVELCRIKTKKIHLRDLTGLGRDGQRALEEKKKYLELYSLATGKGQESLISTTLEDMTLCVLGKDAVLLRRHAGDGSFKVVKEAISCEHSNILAVAKISLKSFIDQKTGNEVHPSTFAFNEFFFYCSVYQVLKKKKIKKLTGILPVYSIEHAFFGNDPYQLIKMKFCNEKDLLEVLQKWTFAMQNSPRDRKEVHPDFHMITGRDMAKMALQLAKGLRHIHSQDILHRDIKVENFFVSSEYEYSLLGKITKAWKAYIGDGGFASTTSKTPDYCGSMAYIAPEILEDQKAGKPEGNYSKNSDIYAFGVSLFCMFNGKMPLQCYPMMEGKVTLGIQKISALPNPMNVTSACDFIAYSCMQLVPGTRPKIQGVCQFIKDHLDEIGDEIQIKIQRLRPPKTVILI